MAETLPTTPTKEDETKQVPSPATNGVNAKKFDGDGLPFRAKLIGMEDLSVDRDEKICLDSMFKLKAVAKARGEHKQRIQLNLTMKAVTVMDETSKTLIATHEIERISFVVLDPKDNRAFGYIYNTSDDRHQFWAIKTERAAAATVLALKDLFELAFEDYYKGKGQTEPSAPTPAPAVVPVVPKEVVPLPALVDPSTPVSLPPPPATVQTPVVEPPRAPTPVEVKPEPPVVKKEEPSLLDIDNEPVAPVLSPLLQNPWAPKDPVSVIDFNVPDPVFTQAKPAPAIDPLEDIFSNLNMTTTTITTNDELFGLIPPISTPPFNPLFPTPTVQTTFPSPTPMFPTPVAASPPPTTAVPQDLLAATPISPVAPPTVTSPFASFDLLGLSSGTGGKITRDAFYNNQPPKQSIQQLQMDKKP